MISRAFEESFSEITQAMAKNDKKEKKDSDPDFLLPKEEGAIEIPEPFEDNDSTIAMSGSDLEKAEALDPPEVEVDSFEEISIEGSEDINSEDSSDFASLDEDQIENTKQPEIKKTMLARDSDIEDALDDSGFNIPEFGSESSSSEVISIANGNDAEEEVQAPSPKKTQLASKQSKHTQFAPAGSEIEPDQETGEEDVSGELAASANDYNSEEQIEKEAEGAITAFDGDPVQETNQSTDDDDFDKYSDPDIGNQTSESEPEPEQEPEEAGPEPVAPPRKRGGMLVGAMVGTILGAGIFGGLYEFGIEIPQEFRMNKSEAVIALENGKKRAESDAKSKAEEVAKTKDEAAKADEDNKTKEKVFLAKHEAELKKAADDKKTALDEADKTYKESLKDADKKLVDQKTEADEKIEKTKLAADKKVKETEDTAKKEIAEEKKTTEKKLTEADTKLAMLKDEKTKVEVSLKKSEDFVGAIGTELSQANLVKDKSNPTNVVDGLKKGMEIIQSKDPQGMIRGLQTKLVDDTTKFTKQIEVVDKKLKESRQPGEMLDYWRTLMEKKGQAELEKKATEDVEKVMMDAAANPELKARAEVLKGITLRNQGKYVEAKALLEKGKAALNAGDIAWKVQADIALKEANDPVTHFVELSKKQESMNQIVESVSSLSKAIELSTQFSPKRRAELLADRCLVEIERAQVRAKGKPQLNDPSLLAAAKDADEAVLSKTALGYYAKGRVAEVRGEIIDAIDFYRKAVNENKALDAQGIVYRIALARLLNSILPTNIKPKEADVEKVGVLEKKEPEMLTNLFALLLTGFYFQQPEIVFPPESPKISPKESRKLADEILASPDAPFDAKAQAYAIKGLPTKAIREYVIGLREKMGPIHFENLMKIIEDHPSLTNHNLANQANPVEAERFYATGMALYFNKRYLEAEKAFMAAVENERQDARYQYYLGLSRLAQNKAEAAEAFEAASKYEKLGRPSRAAVSTSLERVQGPQRQVLNTYRNNPNR
ncbi:MAG: hypothetical protein NTV50_07550 [Planctomycetota bacterium]|nr:hypothetical protein [Planctomycetota bacterium]